MGVPPSSSVIGTGQLFGVLPAGVVPAVAASVDDAVDATGDVVGIPCVVVVVPVVAASVDVAADGTGDVVGIPCVVPAGAVVVGIGVVVPSVSKHSIIHMNDIHIPTL